MYEVTGLCGKTLAVALLATLAMTVNAATVWTGPAVTFNKNAIGHQAASFANC